MNVHEQIGSLSAQQIANLTRHHAETLHSQTLSPLSAAQVMELSRTPEVNIASVCFEHGKGDLDVENHFVPPVFAQQSIASMTMSQLEAMTVH